MTHASHYDKTYLTYTPDGRVLQIEYAREAVKRSQLIFGMKINNSILLTAEKTNDIFIEQSDKIGYINESISIVGTGIVGDTRAIIDFAINEAQAHILRYDEDIPVSLLVTKIADALHGMTRSSGYRILGTAFIVAAIEDGEPRLFGIDVSGAFNEFKAVSYGEGSDELMETLKEKITDEFSADDIEKLFSENVEFKIIEG